MGLIINATVCTVPTSQSSRDKYLDLKVLNTMRGCCDVAHATVDFNTIDTELRMHYACFVCVSQSGHRYPKHYIV